MARKKVLDKLLNMRAMIVGLVALAILLGGLAAWQRFSHGGLPPGGSLALSDLGAGLLGDAEWSTIGGMQSGSQCRMICRWCGVASWSRWNDPVAVCPSCKRPLASRAGFATTLGNSPGAQARLAGGVGAAASGAIPIQQGVLAMHGNRGPCTNCHNVLAAAGSAAPVGGTMVAMPWAAGPEAAPPWPAVLPAHAGHWQGMSVMAVPGGLTAAQGVAGSGSGVLVEEATLVAARTGLRAGDVLVAIDEMPVRDLSEFLAATRRVASRTRAGLRVLRRGRPVELSVTAPLGLGVAQLEGAPAIRAGLLSAPHGDRGECWKCHAIR